MLKNKPFVLFIILSAFFIGNAIVAEFIGCKIFSLEESLGITSFNISMFGESGLGFNLTAGVLLWPIVFIMTDLINEYYGPKAIKFLSYLTVCLIIYAFIMVYFAINTSPNSWWAFQSGMLDQDPSKHVANMDVAFNKVMGQGLWIIFGSVVAFLVGQVLDVFIFHKIKERTGEGQIWLRATGSTVISQFVDSFVVLIIAFYIGADWSLPRVLAIGCVNYIYKFIMALVLTPVIYLVHRGIENYLGQDAATEMKRTAMGLE